MSEAKRVPVIVSMPSGGTETGTIPAGMKNRHLTYLMVLFDNDDRMLNNPTSVHRSRIRLVREEKK